MLTHFKEFGKNCAILGFREVKIDDLEGFLEVIGKEKPADVAVQFFDADLVATWRHLYFSALNALVAFENRENVSKSLSMETMLYASAQRQIRGATQLLGIKPTSSNMAVMIIGGKGALQTALLKISACVDGTADDSVLRLSEKKVERIKKAFEISDEELEAVMEAGSTEKAVVDLVVERVALLATVG